MGEIERDGRGEGGKAGGDYLKGGLMYSRAST